MRAGHPRPVLVIPATAGIQTSNDLVPTGTRAGQYIAPMPPMTNG